MSNHWDIVLNGGKHSLINLRLMVYYNTESYSTERERERGISEIFKSSKSASAQLNFPIVA